MAAAIGINVAAEAAVKNAVKQATGKAERGLLEYTAKQSKKIARALIRSGSDQLAKLGIKSGEKLAAKSAAKAAQIAAAKLGTKIAAQTATAAETGPAFPFVEAAFLALDILNFGLDVGDAGGYGKMGTNEAYFKMRDGINKELKDAMIKAGADWPIYVGPLSKLAEDEFNKLVGDDTNVIISDKNNPLSKPMYDAIYADVKAGIDTTTKDYSNLIDSNKIYTQSLINICKAKGGKIISSASVCLIHLQ